MKFPTTSMRARALRTAGTQELMAWGEGREWRRADSLWRGEKAIVREAYLVSDQTHRKDERRKGRTERRTVRQASHVPGNVGLQDLTPNLRRDS